MDTPYEIVPFSSADFGELRVLNINSEPWFVASDVACALGYRMASDMTRRLDSDEKGTRSMRTPGGEQRLSIINEAGLYSAILGSKVPGAKAFQRWVTHEVLPSIRKRGGYMTARQNETPEQIMARALMLAKDTMDRQKREIEELRPKAMFADAVAASDGTCLVGELAKMLTQSGFQIGQNRLFALLREEGYLGKSGSNRNVPIQRYVEQGLFRIKETAITHSDGHVTLTRTTKVTGKGQAYFVARYCGEAA